MTTAALVGGPNPYVAFSVGSVRQKTKVKWNHREADWHNANFEFIIPRERISTTKLHVRVYDKERVRRKRLLGLVSLQLTGVDIRNIDNWFALEGGECAGLDASIHLCLAVKDEVLDA